MVAKVSLQAVGYDLDLRSSSGEGEIGDGRGHSRVFTRSWSMPGVERVEDKNARGSSLLLSLLDMNRENI
jgi:hypothetical protein